MHPTFLTLLFADDTTFLQTITMIIKLTEPTARLKKLLWINPNRLSLNDNKTVALLFTNRNHALNSYKIQINDAIFNFSTTPKFLNFS